MQAVSRSPRLLQCIVLTGMWFHGEMTGEGKYDHNSGDIYIGEVGCLSLEDCSVYLLSEHCQGLVQCGRRRGAENDPQ